MRIQEPLTFAVTHVGRGGDVACRCGAGELLLPIEMEAEGFFCVWLRGARLATPGRKERPLRTEERKLVIERLRAWLDATGRTGWSIER
jgi:hypothetical protein